MNRRTILKRGLLAALGIAGGFMGCESRSNNASLKRPIGSAAPE